MVGPTKEADVYKNHVNPHTNCVLAYAKITIGVGVKLMPKKVKYNIKVGITMGDPSGIGAVIIAKALNELGNLAHFVVIGDEYVFKKAQSVKRKPQNSSFTDLKNVDRKSFSFGKVKAEYGRASIEYLDKALGMLNNKRIDCLITCPISKEAVQLAGIRDFRGHTEYLARQTNTRGFLMMLLNRFLKFTLLTTHIPLKMVAASLTKEQLSNTIILTGASLFRLFGIASPRLVVCGVNPHASDNGLIGDEENKIIRPVIKRLKARYNLDGPIPSDVAILKAKNGLYDCVIAMYHDQALIPLKLSDPLSGVNITLGLPFVRTSPLHGTAFDIAQKSKLANPSSLIAAINLAIKCTQNLKRV